MSFILDEIIIMCNGSVQLKEFTSNQAISSFQRVLFYMIMLAIQLQATVLYSLLIFIKHYNKILQSNLVITKLFTNARLFTIYEVNWPIGHGKWFTIARLFTIQPFLITQQKIVKIKEINKLLIKQGPYCFESRDRPFKSILY